MTNFILHFEDDQSPLLPGHFSTLHSKYHVFLGFRCSFSFLEKLKSNYIVLEILRFMDNPQLMLVTCVK